MTSPRHVASGLPGYRAPLRVPAFRRLWVAAVVSRAGDAINFVALPLLAYATTRSAAGVAALVIVEGAALVVGGSAAQLVVDRLEPRRLLVALDLGRAAAAAALALSPTYPTALVAAAVLALGTSCFSPTSGALVPRLVGRESLPAANALLWTAGVLLQLVAAPLGGLLFTLASPRVAFGLNALSFAASALILARLPRQGALSAGGGPWRQLPEVMGAIRSFSMLRSLLVMQALAALAVGATSALLVVLAQRAYGLNGTGYGVWLAVVGVGALAGPVVVPALARLAPARAVPGAYLIRGAGDIGLGLTGNAIAGGGLLFLYGLNTSSGSVAFQTLVQESAPPGLRGRVFALLDVTWQFGRLVSIGLGGGLAVAVGIRPVFVGGGILLGMAGAVGLLTLPAGPVRPWRPRPRGDGTIASH
ncbi:MAG: MFS transporter [Candidatus Dormibacteria bacterium]